MSFLLKKSGILSRRIRLLPHSSLQHGTGTSRHHRAPRLGTLGASDLWPSQKRHFCPPTQNQQLTDECKGFLKHPTNGRLWELQIRTYVYIALIRNNVYTNTMRVAIYCRVSTRDKGQDNANQLLQLREHAARQGWTVVKVYEEEISGRKSERDRAALRQMFEDAAKHQWDCLLFWSLDRLTREGTFQTLKYLNRLTDLGLKFCSLNEPYINSQGVFGDVVVSLLSCLALQETQRLGARTRAGLERARSEGRIGGRPRVDVKQDAILRLHEGGKSLTVIAEELGIGRSTAHRMLQNAQSVR